MVTVFVRILGLLILVAGGSILAGSLLGVSMSEDKALAGLLTSGAGKIAGGTTSLVGAILILLSFKRTKRRESKLPSHPRSHAGSVNSPTTDRPPDVRQRDASATNPVATGRASAASIGSARSAASGQMHQGDEPGSRRVADLTLIAEALARYHVDHGVYPKSAEWQGFSSAYGASLGANWIPELAPAYLSALPRDPDLEEAGELAQYLFYSTGADYKLIAHRSGDYAPEICTDQVKIDPMRTNATPAQSAYGVWSKNGATF